MVEIVYFYGLTLQNFPDQLQSLLNMQKKLTMVPVVCIWEAWHLICSAVVKWCPESSSGWHSLVGGGVKGMAMVSLCIQQLQEFQGPKQVDAHLQGLATTQWTFHKRGW